MENLLIAFELALTKRHQTHYIPISSPWRIPIEAAIEKPIEVAMEGLLI